LDWLGLPNTIDNLRAELRLAGLPTVLLLHVIIGTALDKLVSRRLYVDVAIDDVGGGTVWRRIGTFRQRLLRLRTLVGLLAFWPYG
jgi:hypothetical protein